VLVDDLEHLVADTPWAPRAGDRKAGALRKRVRHDWTRVVAAVARAEAALDVEARQRGLHEARKAAKRARDAAEPLVPIYGADAERFVEAVTEIQEALGDLNDALVAMRELPDLDTTASAGNHTALTLDVLHIREQEAAAESEARFKKAWRKARRKKVLRWLG
ncbi:CHAD domain-containing protein, partial [Nocardioides sp.]|uniref:CHAD domain-containing protein n=1 Tax=Nocardioides sp. TaxID=35761 RepID=UPI002735B764